MLQLLLQYSIFFFVCVNFSCFICAAMFYFENIHLYFFCRFVFLKSISLSPFLFMRKNNVIFFPLRLEHIKKNFPMVSVAGLQEKSALHIIKRRPCPTFLLHAISSL